MDIFRKKRIEHLEGRVLELEAQLQEMKNREASLQAWHERRKKELEEREKDLFMRGLAQAGQLEHLQKRLHRIREAALMVRAGKSPVEKLMQEILHGKVR
jgi:6-phosphogluconate dehydrogenase